MSMRTRQFQLSRKARCEHNKVIVDLFGTVSGLAQCCFSWMIVAFSRSISGAVGTSFT